MFDFQKMIKQAQKLQGQMGELQQELENSTFEGLAGGGSIKVTANGKHQYQSIVVAPEALEDKAMLEDLILTALNDLTANINRTTEEKMKGLSDGLNLPGIKLPGLS